MIGSASSLIFAWDEVGGVVYDELGADAFEVGTNSQLVSVHVGCKEE